MAALRVLITGASTGLGAALARHYVDAGATVGLVARSAERLSEQLAALARTAHSGAVGMYIADVADAQAMQSIAAQFIAAHGLPDIVIANAGISVGADPALAEDLPVLERTLKTNVCGIANSFQPFIAPMRERGGGKLVGIASVAGIRGLAGSSAYSASKAAAIVWLESLRLDLRGSGVEALTICPGYIDTPMTRVNPYRMPFMLDAREGARRIARAIARGKAYAVVPWQMAFVAAVLRCLPRPMYDAMFARAPRKPRKLPL
jgi:short-subunit dehydrogenase